MISTRNWQRRMASKLGLPVHPHPTLYDGTAGLILRATAAGPRRHDRIHPLPQRQRRQPQLPPSQPPRLYALDGCGYLTEDPTKGLRLRKAVTPQLIPPTPECWSARRNAALFSACFYDGLRTHARAGGPYGADDEHRRQGQQDTFGAGRYAAAQGAHQLARAPAARFLSRLPAQGQGGRAVFSRIG